MRKTLKVLGILSIAFGVAAALLCVLPFGIKGIFFAVIAGFFGMLCSTSYIFIDGKYQITEKKITPGVIGILLCSIPVLLIFAFKIIHHYNA